MKFNVILPVRNGMPYIKKSIQSILDQSYQNFNLYILDNNSKDGTSEFLQTLQDPRVFIKKSKISYSIEKNWSRILSLKIHSDEYITIIGHDDIMSKNCLQNVFNYIPKLQNTSFIEVGTALINSKGDLIKEQMLPLKKENFNQFFFDVFNSKRVLSGTGFFFRMSCYKKVGGIPSFQNLAFADYALFAKLLEIKDKVSLPFLGFKVMIHRKSQTFLSNENVFANIRGVLSLADVINKVSFEDDSNFKINYKIWEKFFFKTFRNQCLLLIVFDKFNKSNIDKINTESLKLFKQFRNLNNKKSFKIFFYFLNIIEHTKLYLLLKLPLKSYLRRFS